MIVSNARGRRRPSVRAVVAGLLLVLAGGATARAEVKLAGPEFAPYYEKIDGRMTGPLADILTVIWKNAGYQTTGDIYPAPRLMQNLVDGVSDSSLLVRNKTLDEADTVLRSPQAITEMVLNVYSRDAPVAIKSRDDFHGRSIVVMRGYGYGGLRAWMDDKANDVTLLEANNVESVVGMVSAGRAPLALLYDVNFEAAVQALGKRPDNVVVNEFQRVPLYIYLSKRSSSDPQGTMDKLMATYEVLVQKGVLRSPQHRPEEVVGGHKGS
jgi:polar amino acid transport system substrate-binding protein